MSIVQANELAAYVKKRHEIHEHFNHPLDLPLPSNVSLQSREDIHRLKRAIPDELHGTFNLVFIRSEEESRCIGLEINPDKGLDQFTVLGSPNDMQMHYSFRHRGMAQIILDESFRALLLNLPDTPFELPDDVGHWRRTKQIGEVAGKYASKSDTEQERYTGGEACEYQTSYRLSEVSKYLRHSDREAIERIKSRISGNLHGLFCVDVARPREVKGERQGMVLALVFDPYTSIAPLNDLLNLEPDAQKPAKPPIKVHPITPLSLPRDTVLQRAKETASPAHQRA